MAPPRQRKALLKRVAYWELDEADGTAVRTCKYLNLRMKQRIRAEEISKEICRAYSANGYALSKKMEQDYDESSDEFHVWEQSVFDKLENESFESRAQYLFEGIEDNDLKAAKKVETKTNPPQYTKLKSSSKVKSLLRRFWNTKLTGQNVSKKQKCVLNKRLITERTKGLITKLSSWHQKDQV